MRTRSLGALRSPVCRDCDRTQDETTFRLDGRTRTGYASRCEPCRTGTRRPSLDAVIVLARQLLPQDRAVLLTELTRLVEVDTPVTDRLQSAVNQFNGLNGRLVAVRKPK